MKKTLFLLLFFLVIISCGDKSHNEYTFSVGDDVRITDRLGSIESRFPNKEYSSDNELAQIFTVVPGDYTITSDTENVPGGGVSSGVNLKLKLKLLKPVEIINFDSPEFFFGINLIDADDNLVNDGTMLSPMFLGEIKFNKDRMMPETTQKDEFELFQEFLQSSPGTEAELTFGMPAHWDSYKHLENVRNIEIYISPALADYKDPLKLAPKKWKFK